MTRRQRQQWRRDAWKRRLQKEFPDGLRVDPDTYEQLCRHIGRPPRKTIKGRHGGRLEQHPALVLVNGRAVWVRNIKKGEVFTTTPEMLAKIGRRS